MTISYTEFYPYQSTNIQSMGRYSLLPVCHWSDIYETHACLTTFCTEIL
jgi:hypothetical protein